MVNRIRNLKITDIIFLILLSCFFIVLMTVEREGPENSKEQVALQKPWLEITSCMIRTAINKYSGSVSKQNCHHNMEG